MLPDFFDANQSRSRPTPRCAEIQPMSQEVAATSRNMSLSVHALLRLRAPDAVLVGYADALNNSYYLFSSEVT